MLLVTANTGLEADTILHKTAAKQQMALGKTTVSVPTHHDCLQVVKTRMLVPDVAVGAILSQIGPVLTAVHATK